MSTLLPWQQSQWQRLQASCRQNRMPHALILTGPQGLGKNRFASLFAQSLLCDARNTDGTPCGQCRYCQLYLANSHPDVRFISPLEDKKGIGVDQIREIGQFMSLKSQYVGHKLVLVNPADAMNMNAANSLLKTLEEPTADTVLLLVTHQPTQLPATIRSRCQEISFGTPDRSVGKTWLTEECGNIDNLDLFLALADNAPLRAKQHVNQDRLEQRQTLFNEIEQLSAQKMDPAALAARCCKIDFLVSIEMLYSWVTDMIRYQSAGQGIPHSNNPDLTERLLNLANQVSLTTLFHLQDRVRQAQQEFEGNLNPVSIMEAVLIQWQHAFRIGNRKIA